MSVCLCMCCLDIHQDLLGFAPSGPTRTCCRRSSVVSLTSLAYMTTPQPNAMPVAVKCIKSATCQQVQCHAGPINKKGGHSEEPSVEGLRCDMSSTVCAQPTSAVCFCHKYPTGPQDCTLE